MAHSSNNVATKYPAEHFCNSDNTQVLVEVIKESPLATLLFLDDDAELHISHIPFHFDERKITKDKENQHGDFMVHNLIGHQLMAHVSNQHPLAQKMKTISAFKKDCNIKNNVTLIFHGEDGYISPHDISAEYSSQQKVPTWNYAKVHISGHVNEVTDIDEKYRQMLTSSDYFEQVKVSKALTSPDKNTAWLLSSAPSKAIEHMLTVITVFRLTITHIEGRFKLSQNKSKQVRQQITEQLNRRKKCTLANQINQYRAKSF